MGGRNRFSEFLAHRKEDNGYSDGGEARSPSIATSPSLNGDNEANPSDTEKYLAALRGIENDIGSANSKVGELGALHDQLLNSADGAKSEDIAGQRDEKSSQINHLISKLKNELNAVQQMNESSDLSPSDKATRKSKHSVLVRRLMGVLDKYRSIERESQKRYRQRMERHIRLVKPDATDKEVAEAVGNEATRSIFAMEVMSSHRSKMARRVLRDVENRDKDIRNIGATIEQLNQMFGEMEDVVTQQQDVLDNIEQAVDETHVDMDQGNVEVKKATRFRIKARKKTWCILCLIFLVVVAIALGVTLPLAINKKGGNNSNSRGNSVVQTSGQALSLDNASTSSSIMFLPTST